jgi:hypothetical protein
MRTAAIPWAYACIAALCACGSGESSPPLLQPITAEEYCAALPAAACRAERCEQFVVRTFDDCVTQRRQECIDVLLPALRRSIAAGRASFDGDAAARCIRDLGGPCVDRALAKETCDRVVVGLVPAGGVCAHAALRGGPDIEECASGNCPRACPAVCPIPPAPPERPRPSPLGGSCTLEATGTNTSSNILLSPPCAAGLACVPDDVATNVGGGTCQAVRGRGGPCSYSWHCAAGLTCVDGACGDYLPEGAACRRRSGPSNFGGFGGVRSSTAVPPDSGPCAAGLYCGSDVCARLPHLPGERCILNGPFGHSLPCFGEVVCAYIAAGFACATRGTDGEPCPCAAGHYCGPSSDGARLICFASRAEGTTCAIDRECASGYCDPSGAPVCRLCEP